MDLYQLRYFLAVAETGSFTKAAARSFVTQPTLSVGIRKLEDELGTPLFERNRRRVRLTDAGRRLLPRARTILQECAAARAEARAEPSEAPLRIGLLKTLGGPALPALFAEFGAAQRGVRLSLAEGSADDLDRELEGGRLDAVISTLTDAPLPPLAVELYREPYLIAVSRRHALARKPTLRIAELHEAPFVLRTHCEAMFNAYRAFHSHGVQPKVDLRTDNDERALALVGAGMGATFAPECLLGPGVAGLELKEYARVRRIGLRWRAGVEEPLARFRSFAESHDWLPKGAADLAWAR